LQDIIAIAAMLILQIIGNQNASENITLILIAFPVLLIMAYLFQRYILSALLTRFDTIQEYIFILSIGWCLFMAELSHFFGLTEEIGAFIAGVALASNPISFYIAENLKQLRDFFLVLFFFSIGASFNFGTFGLIFAPACLLAGMTLMLKPMVFNWLLRQSGEINSISWEIGVRLGQMSEFSLLLITIALQTQFLSSFTGSVAQAAIIITFIVSCYWTVLWYPTPLAATARLRRD
jgi:Kef-type K+ transport system membrane component KefB